MLSVIIKSIMLNGIMLSVIMLKCRSAPENAWRQTRLLIRPIRKLRTEKFCKNCHSCLKMIMLQH